MPKKILVIGSSNTDMVIKTGHLPEPGETVLGGAFVMGAGGKGANQAVAGVRLGGDVGFVCKVGEDMFGRQSLEQYRKEGISTGHCMVSESVISGVALITVDAVGENCIVVAPGANAGITAEDIDSISDLIKSSDILLMQLEIPVEAVSRAAEIARSYGVYVVLNPAPACNLPDSLLRNVSLIIPNRSELEAVTGISCAAANSVLAAADALIARGVKELVVTLGSKGSCIIGAGDPVFVPARKVEAIDTTAAGDTFCAGVCVGLSEGMDLEHSVRFATAASSLAVMKLGAQDSIPYRKEVDLIL